MLIDKMQQWKPDTVEACNLAFVQMHVFFHLGAGYNYGSYNFTVQPQQRGMMMQKLKINRIDFEAAFELSSYETTAYLDMETGAVIFVEDYVVDQLEGLLVDEDSEDVETVLQAQTDLTHIDRQQLLDAARIEGDADNRYRMIPKQDSRDGYRDMQEYIWTLEDEHLRELLEIAIQGSGAFRRFKDVLSRYPEAQENWFKFRDEREKRRMTDWLASQGIEPEFE